MSDSFDIVWWRRPRKPYIPESLNKNDIDCAKKENFLFHHSTPLIINPDAWWINPYESIKYADSKIYQLKEAPKFNLKIPSTLISNCPKNIKTFINSYPEVIYKPFFPHNWYENEVLKFSYTQKVSLQQLPSDLALQMTPGIFQQKIHKSYELRVTCFGDFLVAVKIHSQEHPLAKIDWRIASSFELKLEHYVLPEDLERNIRNFMKHLGIVFGCFDFIVTPENDIYFLEVNQQGQFLWIEDICPEIKMLDIFVQFMVAKKSDFEWKPKDTCIQLNDYKQEVSTLVATQIQQHVYLNKIKQAS